VGRDTERTELAPAAGTAARVALVHDFLLDLRGAERAFLELCDLWPDADIYTVVYDEDGTEGRFAGRTIHTSFLQRLRPSDRTFRALLPLYPAAVESLALGEYDLVLSSSSAWAHAVLCHERSTHVSYCYNPFRYAWSDRDRTLADRPDPVSRAILRGLFRRWRQWDWIAAQRVDQYIAISLTTQDRIAAYFGRESVIVHPPVETARFTPGPVGDHYALVSELMRHKEIEIAVQAFNDLRLPLVVVGDGPDWRRLRRMAGPTVHFAGRLTDTEVAQVLQSARALIVTAVEEFGIVAVEAQAAGRPVIARRGGGALETVVAGATGSFFSGGPRALARAVLEFDEGAIDPDACRANAARFDSAIFRRRMLAQVEAATRDSADAPARPARRAGSTGRRVRRPSPGPRH
jgi:glycosyltransferase involved in cell wall biosynthesis